MSVVRRLVRKRDARERPVAVVLAVSATAAVAALVVRESDDAVVLGRYSISYAIVLVLAAVNTGLAWSHAVRGVSLVHRLADVGWPLVACFAATVVAVALLVDVVTPRPLRPVDLLAVVLFGGAIFQLDLTRQPVRPIGRYVALVSCSLLSGLILVEVLFRAFLVEERVPRSHEAFVRLMMAKAQRFSARDLVPLPPRSAVAWTSPVPLHKPAQTVRILGLSDSFGLAGGTTHNYHYVLRDLLQEQSSSRIELLNISVDGVEPLHQLEILKFGMAYFPDLVLHGVFVGNDFGEAPDQLYVYREIPVNPGFTGYRPRHFFARSWVLGAGYVVREAARRRQELKDGVVDTPGSLSRATYWDIQSKRLEIWGRLTLETRKRFAAVIQKIDEIRMAAERGGARYVMVIHPDELQVDGAIRGETLRANGKQEEAYDRTLPQRLLMNYCVSRKVACVDLLPAFQAAAAEGPLYLLRDTHYNERGNRLAAARLAEFLRE